MPSRSFLLAFAGLLAPLSAAQDGRVLRPDDVPQETGVPGTVLPQATDVVAEDALVHEDTTGTASRDLVEVCGAPGRGFLVAWRDGRDANAGLYLAEVAADGQPKGPERPFYTVCRVGRQIFPAMALSPSGAGALCWRDNATPTGQFYCRRLLPGGQLEDVQYPMGNFDPSGPVGVGNRMSAKTSVAVLPDRSALCVWHEGSGIHMQVLRADESAPTRPSQIHRPERPGDGHPLIASAPSGAWICVWKAGKSIDRLSASAQGSEDRGDAGPGTPLRLAFDPSTGGWWLLVELESRRLLRHLSRSGAVDIDDVNPAPANKRLVDFAAASWGLVTLVANTPPEGQSRGGRAGSHEVILLSTRGEPLERATIPVKSREGAIALTVRVAAAGDSALVAWSERRGTDTYIVCRSLDAQGHLGPASSLGDSPGSANQTYPMVSAAGADRAVVTWIDHRVAPPQIYARVLSSRGGFASGEIALPVPVGDVLQPTRGAGQQPSVAVDAQGRFIVAWMDAGEGRIRACVQAFDRDAKPLGPAVVLDESASRPDVEYGSTAVTWLGDERGWCVAWAQAGTILARGVNLRGEPVGEQLLVSDPGEVANPAIATLAPAKGAAGSRVVIVWDVSRPKILRRLRARFLDPQLALEGPAISFDTMYRADDWGARVCATADGGFAMTWTTGEARDRDVFARVFDAAGKPASRPFAVSVRIFEQDFPSIAALPDGSIALAWEDDIFYFDYPYLRRLSADRKTIGPVVTISQRPEEFAHVHGFPHIAAVDTGLVAVWNDCRRSKGSDIYWKVLGPRFDADAKAASDGTRK